MNKKLILKSLFFLSAAILIDLIVSVFGTLINYESIKENGFFETYFDYLIGFVGFASVGVILTLIVFGTLTLVKKVYEKLF